MRDLLLRLVRSGGGGALATLADLATLTGLVQLAHVSPRAASVVALTLGSVVMFFAQKHLVFRRAGSPQARELVLFTLVQAGGYVLTLAAYDQALRFVPWFMAHYVIARLIVTNLVWVAYSFPLWHWVFRPRTVDKPVIRP